jgi:uncharacterized RDD family membrane protein YckC
MLLLAGVRASAAQKLPVNTICSQCGAVLASGVYVCNFCDSSKVLPLQEKSAPPGQATAESAPREEWRGELNQRLQAYRSRRRKTSANEGQSALPFEERAQIFGERPQREIAVQVEEPAPETRADDFAFTIAIGRLAREPLDPRVLIDVSNPPELEGVDAEGVMALIANPAAEGFLPVAALAERKKALLIDAGCLAFAYGSFLILFGSLGGEFTFNKLSAAVCVCTFAFVYLQYFGLFTIFGGSTPGMMLSGLQVASSTGDMPTPRQHLLRAAGYMLSAGTCFLGFMWVLWDEEGLTWHDRISRTYLTSVESLGEELRTAR